MIREKTLRAMIGWLCTMLVLSMYVLIPIIEILLSMDVSSYTSTLFAFLIALFMELGKPTREIGYRCFWRDGWLPMLGWICSLVFCFLIFHPIVYFVLSTVDLVSFSTEIPAYSMGEKLILFIIILRVALYQVFGKSLSEILEGFLSDMLILEK